ncbi:mitochondrial 54S ribosomal protein mL50 MRPL13 NDAI_0K01980 [Naumovozyma dairenensis CBS 421]|uniref:Large ribosomal subunit protein mL50 n=1 Tax=Naumovozyma dairenensis (strain ATCC 10597 / BCRC 20456 / CBS 421 / NBRC 0211 / NRRL Y-12639) TaxID=1071378 RepID=G0WHX8_NAUDC|nr:hypothetical protein NDAI_0K01980 [Naumovozyma dairenensis CBS 421]CCD27389.1 hypothetical protein NDAI_0K01980 [Naumovozyma dairenensis CBS 421]
MLSINKSVLLEKSIRNGNISLTRNFHVINSPSLDIMDWFKSRNKMKGEGKDTEGEESVKIVNKRATKDLIQDIETRKDNKDDTDDTSLATHKLKLIPENFIGRRNNRKVGSQNKRLYKDAPFNYWLNKTKVQNETELEKIMESLLNEVNADKELMDEPLPDLVTKFKFVKELQAKTGYMIPDYQITIMNTPAAFKQYYIDNIFSGKLQRFKESEPNAIHFENKQFTAPNIYLVNTVDERDISGKMQKKKYNKIIDEVRKMEEIRTKKIIEEARTN